MTNPPGRSQFIYICPIDILAILCYYTITKRKGDTTMTKDWMKKATIKQWTCWDFGYVCYRRGDERKLQKKIKRAARHNAKMALAKEV